MWISSGKACYILLTDFGPLSLYEYHLNESSHFLGVGGLETLYVTQGITAVVCVPTVRKRGDAEVLLLNRTHCKFQLESFNLNFVLDFALKTKS